MKNILLFLLLLLGIYLIRRALGDKSERPKRPPSAAPAKSIEMVKPCAHCGLLVPQSEGVEAGEQFFCSRDHARLGAPAPRE